MIKKTLLSIAIAATSMSSFASTATADSREVVADSVAIASTMRAKFSDGREFDVCGEHAAWPCYATKFWYQGEVVRVRTLEPYKKGDRVDLDMYTRRLTPEYMASLGLKTEADQLVFVRSAKLIAQDLALPGGTFDEINRSGETAAHVYGISKPRD